MSRTPSIYWEDFPIGQVREFGHKLVTREEILDFATKYDPQPFHVNDEAAAASLFGRLAASGWHTCGMVMRMVCDEYLLDSSSLGSPGLENLKWLKPVLVDDVLRVRITVLEKRPMNSKPHIGLVRTSWEALNQRDEIVLYINSWAMFGRREVGEVSAL